MKPNYENPEYVQGQLDALRALILGLAQQTSSREFREQSLERLETTRTALLSSAVSDLRLQAIDDCEVWVRAVTG